MKFQATLSALCLTLCFGACIRTYDGPNPPLSEEYNEGTAVGDEGDAGAASENDNADESADAGVPDEPPVVDEQPDGPQEVPCGKAVEEATEVLETYCASCHGPDSPGYGNFSSLLDAAALVQKGLVVVDDPENSRLYQRVKNGTMPPPGNPRPSDEDIAWIRAWIACGVEDWN